MAVISSLISIFNFPQLGPCKWKCNKSTLHSNAFFSAILNDTDINLGSLERWDHKLIESEEILKIEHDLAILWPLKNWKTSNFETPQNRRFLKVKIILIIVLNQFLQALKGTKESGRITIEENFLQLIVYISS